jgi:hypothetical protein
LWRVQWANRKTSVKLKALESFIGTTDVVNPEPVRRDFILVTLTKFKTDRMTCIVVGTVYDGNDEQNKGNQ